MESRQYVQNRHWNLIQNGDGRHMNFLGRNLGFDQHFCTEFSTVMEINGKR